MVHRKGKRTERQEFAKCVERKGRGATSWITLRPTISPASRIIVESVARPPGVLECLISTPGFILMSPVRTRNANRVHKTMAHKEFLALKEIV